MRAYPNDDLGTSLRNIFDFDIYKPETIERLAEILEHYGSDLLYICSIYKADSFTKLSLSLTVKKLGLDAAREAATKKIHDIDFEPKGPTELDEPKEGEHDPQNEAHQGGNRWAAGVSLVLFLRLYFLLISNSFLLFGSRAAVIRQVQVAEAVSNDCRKVTTSTRSLMN